MKKILSISVLCLLAVAASAQETYENANIATEDLNCTARYVGMGGAMDALGADLSTISTNPAGIGLFRHSAANVSFGLVSQEGGESFANGNKTNMSFDQGGFVYSMRSGRSNFINFAFNYHKSRNFDYILSAASSLDGASQNKLSSTKGALGVFGFKDKEINTDAPTFNQVDYLYYNSGLSDAWIDDNGDYKYYYTNASGYNFNRANTGYIGEYDFNISGNVNDRFYWGVTFGVSDVHYNGYSEYSEALVDGSSSVGNILLADNRKITGTGFNVKGGIIVRPIETSPFRIGVSIATPTWYDLTTSNYTTLALSGDFNPNYGQPSSSSSIGESYDFKLYTPWKFGLSLGTTFGKMLAVGAVYEYSDYGSLDSRYNTGGDYDYYGYYYDSSSSDNAMNRHTESTLKGVSTLKLGLELKPMPELAIRLGYNYVSPMYEKSGYKDGTVESYGTYYASATDYTNWKSTNRITCGVGYNIGKMSLDLAYQYSVQNGDFSPFMNYYDSTPGEGDNIADAVKVNNKRHQLILSLGYHF